MNLTKWAQRMPLRYKLLLLLVSLTSISLVVYARLALNIFADDKIAYVFDSSLSHVDAVAKMVRSEVEFSSSKIQFFMKGYQTETGSFHSYTLALQPNDNLIKGIWSYQFDPASSTYTPRGSSTATDLATDFKEILFTLSPELISSALENEVGVAPIPQHPGFWFLAIRFQQPAPNKPIVVIGLLNRGVFLDFFSTPQLQDTYLVSQHSKVLMKPLEPTYSSLTADELKEALNFISQPENSKSSVHTWSSTKTLSSSTPWLIANIAVGIGNLSVVAFVPKGAALATVKLLAVKSTLFLILLIGFAALVSVLSAHQLTAALKKLFEATRNVAQGNFDIAIPVESEDEVGGLTRGFNQMTQEIKRLLLETAEKTRMESELQTAKTVQSTLFPEIRFTSGPIIIEGFYEPASECGGDWWYYNKVGTKTYLWIGDATGHGVPAALVTSAARSAARILEELPDIPLDQAMSLLNKAINGTSRGKVNMTFFLGAFDEETRILKYCNASHDPPFYVPFKNEDLKKSDILPLMDASGPRLGESPDSNYSTGEIPFHPGDRLVLYTDGVTELRNSEGNLWGERKFIRSLLDTFNQGASVEVAMESLAANIKEYRDQAVLEDDVTYFIFQYLPASEN